MLKNLCLGLLFSFMPAAFGQMPTFFTDIRECDHGLTDEADVQSLLQNTPKPTMFFHWSRPGRPGPLTEGQLTLPPEENDAKYMQFFDSKAFAPNKSVLFLWTNPITGMAATEVERYAYIDKEGSSQLFALKPKATATYAAYVSRRCDPSDEYPLASKADFVLHIRVDLLGVRYIEWVLQNPAAIEQVYSDQTHLKSIVNPYLQNFESVTPHNWEYHDQRHHYIPADFQKILDPYISPSSRPRAKYFSPARYSGMQNSCAQLLMAQ